MKKAMPCVDQMDEPITILVETESLRTQKTRPHLTILPGLKFYYVKYGEKIDVTHGLMVKKGVKLRWQFKPRTRKEEEGTYHLMVLFSANDFPSADPGDGYFRFAPNGLPSAPMTMGRQPNEYHHYDYSATLFVDSEIHGRNFKGRQIRAVATQDPIIIIRGSCGSK